MDEINKATEQKAILSNPVAAARPQLADYGLTYYDLHLDEPFDDQLCSSIRDSDRAHRPWLISFSLDLMRVLLILASLLTACETTWQVHQGPNQAPEVTAARRVFTFYMIKTVSVPATLDPASGGSAASR